MAKKKRVRGRPKAPARAKSKKKKSMGKVLKFRRKISVQSRPRRKQAHGGELKTGGPNAGAGRPSNEFRERCRLALERVSAIDIAVSIARNPRKAAHDRLDALKWLADRGYGRPNQPVTGADDGPIEGTITVRFVEAPQ